ncbi:hypothetical protein HNV12_03770 [Methanococcoides sp. SA1]|nr:hypothetical protein [Methanococcoides sp. SA1]
MIQLTCGQELGCARYIEGNNQKESPTEDACFGMIRYNDIREKYYPICKGDDQPECAVTQNLNLLQRIAMQQGGRK